MNASEIIAKFVNMVDDSLDADFTLQLVNDAMHEVEEDIKPEGLKVTDTSQSTAVGQTYTTGIPLPTDYLFPTGVLYVGTTPYIQVPLERAPLYRDSGNFFYVDLANSTYHLCGRQSTSQVITFPYYYATPDLVVSPSPTSPVWPDRFHSIIPLKMAQMYFAIDGGERGRTWDDRWGAYYEKLLARFRDYDAKFKLASMNYSTAPINVNAGGENKIDI
jgi:hypothetical protein